MPCCFVECTRFECILTLNCVDTQESRKYAGDSKHGEDCIQIEIDSKQLTDDDNHDEHDEDVPVSLIGSTRRVCEDDLQLPLYDNCAKRPTSYVDYNPDDLPVGFSWEWSRKFNGQQRWVPKKRVQQRYL